MTEDQLRSVCNLLTKNLIELQQDGAQQRTAQQLLTMEEAIRTTLEDLRVGRQVLGYKLGLHRLSATELQTRVEQLEVEAGNINLDDSQELARVMNELAVHRLFHVEEQ